MLIATLRLVDSYSSVLPLCTINRQNFIPLPIPAQCGPFSPLLSMEDCSISGDICARNSQYSKTAAFIGRPKAKKLSAFAP